jgi:hypothetical protein
VVPATLFGVTPAEADERESATACAAIASDDARLDCYDGLFRTKAAVAESFGLTEAQKVQMAQDEASAPVRPEAAPMTSPSPATGPATVPKAAPVVDRVESVVAEVSERRNEGTRVTLENGQVWMQVDTSMRLLVRPGDAVTIRAAALGSYTLKAGGRPAVRVRRLK